MVKSVMGILAAVLVIGYLGPVIMKLKDIPLTIVAGIGVVLMLVDLWQSLRSKED